MAEQEQLRSSLRSEKERTLSLEKELTRTDEVANHLQVELTSAQQELQEASDLCSQHEALIEERNTELNGLEAKIR
jgi:predicted  nucleic acid-binding Zn-ribbon protein